MWKMKEMQKGALNLYAILLVMLNIPVGDKVYLFYWFYNIQETTFTHRR